MLYTVLEVSNLTNLSKVSIYKKLKLKELEGHITKKAGITYIDEVALGLITESLKLNEEVKTGLNNNDNESPASEEAAIDSEVLTLNTEIVKTLIEQLKAKDEQIKDLHKLLENSQVLLKNEQENQSQENVLLIEEHVKEMDTKLFSIKEQLEDRKKNNTSWIKRMFNNIKEE
jgi:hypothetical protein